MTIMSDDPWSDTDRELVVSILWTRALQGNNAGPGLDLQPASDAPLHLWADAAAVLNGLLGTGRWLCADPDEPHLIEFRANGWTIQHPVRCRPNLFACPVNQVGEQIPGPPRRGVGVYECDLENGALVIGRRLREVSTDE